MSTSHASTSESCSASGRTSTRLSAHPLVRHRSSWIRPVAARAATRTYTYTGGVNIGMWNRLLYAAKFADVNILAL